MIIGISEYFMEEVVVQKVLRSFLIRFNAKILAIEEMKYFKNLTMDQLLGTLTTYEMRVGKDKTEPKEEAFKVSRKVKKHKDHQECFSYEYD